MQTKETIQYQQIHQDDYEFLINKSGAYAVMQVIRTQHGYAMDLRYLVDGKTHRVDGPARIHADGTLEWHQGGVLHREDGPAIIEADSSGPADPDGTVRWHEQWYLHGKKMAKEDMPYVQAQAIETALGAQPLPLHPDTVAVSVCKDEQCLCLASTCI